MSRSLVKNVQIFRRKVLLPSSGSKSKTSRLLIVCLVYSLTLQAVGSSEILVILPDYTASYTRRQ
jgi:hypothetical protein